MPSNEVCTREGLIVGSVKVGDAAAPFAGVLVLVLDRLPDSESESG